MELLHKQFGTIRVTEADGQFWFCAKDVCDALEYNDVESACRKLDEEEKGKEILRTPGGPQEMLVVNESGLYALILRSNKPQAHAFRKWVTNEVLPALRRTGSYEVKNARQVERDNENAYRQLLKELNREMLWNDVGILARKSRIDQDAIWHVLNGRTKNAIILNEIYLYCLKKKGLERFYHHENGINKAIELLKGEFEKLQLSSQYK